MRQAKKILRKVLLFDRWGGLRSHYHAANAEIKCRIALAKGGIKEEKTISSLVFSKGARRVILPLSTPRGEQLHAIRNFERLFSGCGIVPKENAIDFCGIISLGGFAVRTTIGMALEFSGMVPEYNRHYAIKEGDVVFDCGAFHGLYALLISKAAGKTGRIYCFEPDSGNREILAENLKANGIENAIIVPKGLWKSSGTVSFHSGDGATSAVEFSENAAAGGSGSIEVVSIPDFITAQALPRLDFVKMDIEGAEIEVVEGCLEYLKSHSVNFAIASYHLRNGEETFRPLETLFKSAGYAAKTEISGTITTYAWPEGGEKGQKTPSDGA